MTIAELIYLLIGFILGMWWILFLQNCLKPDKKSKNSLID